MADVMRGACLSKKRCEIPACPKDSEPQAVIPAAAIRSWVDFNVCKCRCHSTGADQRLPFCGRICAAGRRLFNPRGAGPCPLADRSVETEWGNHPFHALDTNMDIHDLTRELHQKNDSKIVMLVADGLGGLPLEPGGL